MDCRWSLLLLVGLAAGAVGCASLGGSIDSLGHKDPTASRRAADEALQEARANSKGAKDKPTASLCVAMGNVRMELASDARRSPVQRQEYYDQARKAYQKALELDPKYIPAHLALARLADDTGDHVRALDQYRQALKLNPKDASVHFEHGMSHARHKEFDLAIEALRTASELEPENRHVAKTLGFCLARAGRYQESMTCLQRQMTQAEAHYNVALMLHHVDQADASCQHLRRALEMDPQLAMAQELLTHIETQAGGVQQAVHTETQQP